MSTDRAPEMIVWRDSLGVGGEWQEPDSLSIEECQVTSLGFVVAENDHWILIVSHVVPATDRSDEQVVGEMQIPKAAIVSRAPLESGYVVAA